MNDVDVTDRDALSLLLRSKTALGRLVESEVHSVLDFLESIGFMHQAVAAPAEPAPVIDPAPAADATTVVPPPGEPAPVIAPPPVS
jgi:hypothetical protein